MTEKQYTISLRNTIRDTTKEHLNSGANLFAQCVKAVGWIGGTVPSNARDGSIIELPTSDVSNGGVVVGHGLAGKRPIYVIRYQGFITYNGASIFNYAAKSKEMWQTPCPVFVRSIAMEGSIGPVASNYHHSTAIRFPGMRVHVPITPKEWLNCWNDFMTHNDPMYCSEHRKTYDFVDGATDTPDFHDENDVSTIIAIGYGRVAAFETALKLRTNFIGLSQLKPLKFTNMQYDIINNSDSVFVIDSDYEYCGTAQYVASQLQKMCRRPKCYAFGLPDKTAGFSKDCDNLTPTPEEICNMIGCYL